MPACGRRWRAAIFRRATEPASRAGREGPCRPAPGIAVIDWIFLLVTGFIAYHGLTFRNPDGENDIGHLLFGSIALLFFLRVLFVDILRVW